MYFSLNLIVNYYKNCERHKFACILKYLHSLVILNLRNLVLLNLQSLVFCTSAVQYFLYLCSSLFLYLRSLVLLYPSFQSTLASYEKCSAWLPGAFPKWHKHLPALRYSLGSVLSEYYLLPGTSKTILWSAVDKSLRLVTNFYVINLVVWENRRRELVSWIVLFRVTNCRAFKLNECVLLLSSDLRKISCPF